jgi:hypothetical protein
MSRTAWGVLVVAGVAIAIGIGLLASSQSVAKTGFCDDLESLGTSVTNLTSIDPSGATGAEYQQDASGVKSEWDDVKRSAAHLNDVNLDSLDDAWDDFSQALAGVPSQASISDAEQAIRQSAGGLQSAVNSSISSYDCS